MSAVHLHLVDKASKPRSIDNSKTPSNQLAGTATAKKEGAKKNDAPKKDASKKERTKKGKGTKRPSAKTVTTEPVALELSPKRSASKARKRETTAADVMCGPPIRVREHDGLNDAVRLMWDHDVGAVVVVDDDDKPVGIVTDRDACMAAHTQGVALYHGSLAAAMSRTLVSCSVDTPISEVRALMASAQVRRVPVVDDEGKLVGVVGLTDLVKEASAPHPAERKRGSSGAELVAILEAVLRTPA